MMTRRSGAALAATLAAGLACSPVQAEDAAPATAPWKLSVTPYAWAISLHGNAGILARKTSAIPQPNPARASFKHHPNDGVGQ